MNTAQAKELQRGDWAAWRANDGKLRRVVIDRVGRFGRTASVWREDEHVPGRTFLDWVNTSDIERKLP